MFQRHPIFSLSILLGLTLVVGCGFQFDNPAEQLIPGQIRGKTVQEIEGKAGEFEPMPEVTVRLRGAPFRLNSRTSGYFAMLDLPVGDYHLLLEHHEPGAKNEDRRLVQRRVTLAMGADGQIEGVNVGDVPLRYTASVTGVVLNEETKEPIPFAVVSDEQSLISVTADENGHFTFPALAIGEHEFRAAGTLKLGNDKEVQAVGGTFKLTLEKKDERRQVEINDPLPLVPAEGEGRLQLKVGLMSPAPAAFGFDEVQAEAIPCGGGQALKLAPPASNGQLDDSLPAGCWDLQLLPPPGAESAEFDLLPYLPNVIVLDDDEIDLGTVLIASSQSVLRSQNACEVDGDCMKGGKCTEKICEYPDDPEVDLCAENNGGCHTHASCSQELDALLCTCNEGYVGDGFDCRLPGGLIPATACRPSPCDQNASCTESRGEAQCTCDEGYVGDGFECSPDDGRGDEGDGGSEDGDDVENVCDPSPCDENASCTESRGEAQCTCDEGYLGDGFECSPDDDRGDGGEDGGDGDGGGEGGNACDPSPCNENASCIEIDGEAQCSCNLGFIGDGYSCSNNEDPSGLALGSGHSCRIASTGDLWCWGSNSSGQLGLGDSEAMHIQPSPVQAASPHLWKKVATADDISCGINSEDRLFCWGRNQGGLLDGVGENDYLVVPWEIDSEQRWRDIAIASGTICGVTYSGELWCWGDYDSGVLDYPAPQSVSPDSDWTAIFLDHGLRCGARHLEGDDGQSIWCWGFNFGERIPGMPDEIEAPTRQPIFGTFQNRPSLALGSNIICFISEEHDQSLRCIHPRNPTPENIGGSLRWKKVSSNNMDNFCAIDADSQLYCWGSPYDGLIGNGASHDSPVEEPLLIRPDLSFGDVAVGYGHACALSLSRDLYCWGQNTLGQLGLSNWPRVLSPHQVGEESDWRQISTGEGTTCGLRGNSGLWCWGDNTSSRLMWSNDFLYLAAPTLVDEDIAWTQLSQRANASCGIDDQSRLWCWGQSAHFSNFSSQVQEATQVPLREGADGWREVSVGFSEVCALEEGSGSILCAGEPVYQGSTVELDDENQNMWTLLDGPAPFRTLSVGYNFLCAITEDDRLYCQGINDLGQVGTGSFGSTPEAFTEVLLNQQEQPRWIQVSTGYTHACAVNDVHEIWCWGHNGDGQLAVSPEQIDFSPDPVLVNAAGASWAEVSCADIHNCALTLDGDAYCWGSNREGQIGSHTIDDFSEPYALSGRWLSIRAGGEFYGSLMQSDSTLGPSAHSCGIQIDSPGAQEGSLWCWGSTRDGQSGLMAIEALTPELTAPESSY